MMIMPNQTYFNLSDKKREKIFSAVLHEFANHSFSQSSIARIVKNSTISRGSFYQYFDDKFDTYKYLINCIKEEKLDFFKKEFNDATEKGFFDTYAELLKQGALFAKVHPEYEKFMRLFLAEKEDFKTKVFSTYSEEVTNIYKYLLKCGIEKGEIKKDIDLDFVSYLINKIMYITTEYFIDNTKPFSAVLDGLDMIIDILKNGLRTVESEVNKND